MNRLEALAVTALSIVLVGCAAQPQTAPPSPPRSEPTVVEGVAGIATVAVLNVLADALLGESCQPEPEEGRYCNPADEVQRDAAQRREANRRQTLEARRRREALNDEFEAFISRDEFETAPVAEPESVMFPDRVRVIESER